MYSAHRVTKKKEVGSMSRRTVLVLCVLALVPFSLAYGQGGGNGKAMTPVGTWDLEYFPTGTVPPPYKVLWTLNFGGTSLVTAQGFGSGDLLVDLTNWGVSTGHGSWKKVGRRTFRHTVFTLVPWLPTDWNRPAPEAVGNLKGYVKAVHEFTLVDKNTLEGWCELSLVLGRDPSGEQIIPFGPQEFVGNRLRPEPLPAP
jgi:hypothetical protein